MKKALMGLLLVLLVGCAFMGFACTPAEDKNLIKTAEQLKEIALDGDYKLGADLDLSGWVALGSLDDPFTGTLDGNGFAINTLTMSFASLAKQAGNCYYAGLFTSNSGTIKNLTIKNFAVEGDNSASTEDRDKLYVGSFAARNNGTITDCAVTTGKIDIKSADKDSANVSKLRAGLIAGWNGGTINNCIANGSVKSEAVSSTNRVGGICGVLEGGSVTGSKVTASVNAISETGTNSAGGLIGYLEGAGTVQRSSATGAVTSISASGTLYSGGLTGYIDSTDKTTAWNYTIEDCFATGNVLAETTGNCYASGLIARIENTDLACNISVKNCYSLGNAEGKTTAGKNCYVAGLVGRVQLFAESTVTIKNSFTCGNIASTENCGRVCTTAPGTWTEDFFLDSQTITSDSAKTYETNATAATAANLKSVTWQKANLKWSETVWKLSEGNYPTLVG